MCWFLEKASAVVHLREVLVHALELLKKERGASPSVMRVGVVRAGACSPTV
jgi:hypothetical protein